MRHVNAIMFSRWFAASAVLLTSLAMGCGAKPESVRDAKPQTQPASVSDANQATPIEAQAELGGASDPEISPPQPPAEKPLADADVFEEIDNLNEAERPRSLFRSIGRPLQKGVTDATSGASNDTAAPEPTDDADANEPAGLR